MNGREPEAERLMALVAQLQSEDPLLTPIQAALLAAAGLAIAQDSRTFARLLGLSHALVLRELSMLAQRDRVRIQGRDRRTLRTHYALAA